MTVQKLIEGKGSFVSIVRPHVRVDDILIIVADDNRGSESFRRGI